MLKKPESFDNAIQGFHWLSHDGLRAIILEIAFTIAAPAFDILFIGCVWNTKIEALY